MAIVQVKFTDVLNGQQCEMGLMGNWEPRDACFWLDRGCSCVQEPGAKIYRVPRKPLASVQLCKLRCGWWQRTRRALLCELRASMFHQRCSRVTEVVKSSELALITFVELAEFCHNAGLPTGVLNCVPGLGSVAGVALVSNASIKKIDFTGDTTTGRAVAAAAGHNLATSTIELCGKAPLVIFDDVDIDEVVNGVAFASLITSGQTCTQLIVHEKIFDEFVDRLVAKVRSIRLDDPISDSTQMGTVISKEHLLRIHGMVESAKAQGATVWRGGKRAEGLEGYFYEPTVLSNVAPDTEIVKEEVFGPRHVDVLVQGRGRGRGNPARERLAVWTRRRDLNHEHQARAPRGALPGRGHHLAQ